MTLHSLILSNQLVVVSNDKKKDKVHPVQLVFLQFLTGLGQIALKQKPMFHPNVKYSNQSKILDSQPILSNLVTINCNTITLKKEIQTFFKCFFFYVFNRLTMTTSIGREFNNFNTSKVPNIH